MPRAETSSAGRIISFFRTAPLESADLILGLCKDAVTERKQKSALAKARAAGPVATATPAAAAPAAGKVKGTRKRAKKSHKKKPAAPPIEGVDPSLPGMGTAAGEDVPVGEYAEAGDLVNS